MEKINLVELLKDCPKGMELDCTMYENVTLGYVFDSGPYPIKIKTPDGLASLDKYGCYSSNKHAKCVIYPKGKTTWKGFQRPFKDGDIVYYNDTIAIFKEWGDETLFRTYVTKYLCCDFFIGTDVPLFGKSVRKEIRFATEEEKEKLFKAIKDNGYKWNPETKTLEKLIAPKFKAGDRIVKKNSVCVPILITNVSDEFYYTNTESFVGVLSISEQDEYVLLPNKFDINTLIPFESRVLVRDNDYDEWKGAFWSHLRQKADIKYDTIRGAYRQCIPYNNDTKHLLGKTNSCDDYYKNWK